MSAGSVVLDRDAWALVVQAVGEAVPGAFRTGYGLLTGAAQIRAAEDAARRRLQDRDLMDADGGLRPAIPGALEVLAAATVRISVRGWAGERSVLTELGVTAGMVVGLTRLQQVDPAGPSGPAVIADGLGVELSVQDAAAALDVVLRGLPPTVVGAQPSAGTPGGGTLRLPYEDVVALARAVRAEQDARTPGEAFVAQEVVRILAGAAGHEDGTAPALLAGLATGLSGAARVVIDAGGRTWVGLWLLGDGALVAVRLAAGQDGAPAVRLEPSSGEGLRTDLLGALSTALAFDVPTPAGGRSEPGA